MIPSTEVFLRYSLQSPEDIYYIRPITWTFELLLLRHCDNAGKSERTQCSNNYLTDWKKIGPSEVRDIEAEISPALE